MVGLMNNKTKLRKEYDRHWRETHREQIRQSAKKYRQSEKGKLKQRTWHLTHGEMERKSRFARYRKARLEVLTHYGNGRCACVKCGFDDIRALSIDHINNDGAIDRKRHLGGTNFTFWLKRHGFPKGYQTLCMNCQWIKRAENEEDELN